jgi:hypothetical protein
LIKNKAAESIIGQAKKVMSMKDNSKQVKEMEGEHFGGVMEVGIKDNLGMESKVAGVFYIVKVVTDNMKEIGITECLMEKVFNTLKMAKGMKEHLKKINSMVKEYFIKMIQLFMEYGRITNYLW